MRAKQNTGAKKRQPNQQQRLMANLGLKDLDKSRYVYLHPSEWPTVDAFLHQHHLRYEHFHASFTNYMNKAANCMLQGRFGVGSAAGGGALAPSFLPWVAAAVAELGMFDLSGEGERFVPVARYVEMLGRFREGLEAGGMKQVYKGYVKGYAKIGDDASHGKAQRELVLLCFRLANRDVVAREEGEFDFADMSQNLPRAGDGGGDVAGDVSAPVASEKPEPASYDLAVRQKE